MASALLLQAEARQAFAKKQPVNKPAHTCERAPRKGKSGDSVTFPQLTENAPCDATSPRLSVCPNPESIPLRPRTNNPSADAGFSPREREPLPQESP